MAGLAPKCGALAVLAAVLAAGTPARSDVTTHVVSSVTPETCFTVTVGDVKLPILPCSDEDGVLGFVIDDAGLPPGPLTVTVAPADTAGFVICPGQCGVRPQEE